MRTDLLGYALLLGLVVACRTPRAAEEPGSAPPRSEQPAEQDSVPRPVTATRVDSARAQWEAHAPAAYRYTVHYSCFCIRTALGPFTVTVRNGRVESVVDSVGAAVPDSAQVVARPGPIDSLFGTMAALMAQPHGAVLATFNADSGYPSTIHLDRNVDTIDDELTITVSNLQGD